MMMKEIINVNKQLICSISCFLLLFSCSTNKEQEGTSANIENYKGRIVYNIDGKREYPMFYSAIYHTPRKPMEAIGRANYTNFTNAGFDLFEMSIYMRVAWNEDGTLNIPAVEEELTNNLIGITEINPKAKFQIRIMVDPPLWWYKKYPEELVEFANAEIDFTNGNDAGMAPRASLASERWKKESTEMLTQLLDYLQTVEVGKQIFSMMICAGVYNEWYYYGFPYEPDTGIPMTNYFRKWLKSKYQNEEMLQESWNNSEVRFETAQVPNMEERTQHPGGVFRDPEKEQKIIDYFRCQNSAMEEAIFHFTKYVKDYWPRDVLVGIFNGYLLYPPGSMNNGGHLAFNKIIENPNIDFFASPYSYYDPARELGGTGQPRGIVESVNLHGKLYMTEQDNKTHRKAKFQNVQYTRNEEESVASIRRDFAQTVCRATGYWFFDFGSEGFWNTPAMMADIKKQKDFSEELLEKGYKSAADVAFIFDLNSLYYMAETKNPQSTEIYQATTSWMITDAYRSGAAFDSYLFSDLDKIDIDKYKVFVFSTTYAMNDKQIDFINNKVKKNGRTVVWIYAPAYTDGFTLDTRHISRIVGLDIEEMALSVPPEITTQQNQSFGLAMLGEVGKEIIQPLFKVNAGCNCDVLATYTNSTNAAVVLKKEDNYTTVYSSLPLRNPDFIRSIFRDAGVHIYSESNDVLIVGGGVVCLATKRGTEGERIITLRNGRKVTCNLESGETIFIDDVTGEELY